jgi:hypothetical protein
MKTLGKFLHGEYSTYDEVVLFIDKYPEHVKYILNNKPRVSSKFSPEDLEKINKHLVFRLLQKTRRSDETNN